MVPVSSKKRVIYIFVILCAIIVILCFRVGFIQVVKGEEYKSKAVVQQTKNKTVTAKRGKIYDRNGDVLAVSAATYTVWARPASLVKKDLNKTAQSLADKLELKEADVKAMLKQKQSLVKIKDGLETQDAKRIRDAKLAGIEVSEGVTRYYPLGTLASQLIGNVSSDNEGLEGLEKQYNNALTGISGKTVETTDVAGNALSYGEKDYYQAKDGLNLVSTIDVAIQNYAEKAIKKAKKSSRADKVTCLMMNPKTGEILASANTENYDPNEPRTPVDKSEAANLKKLSAEKQLEYLNKMWRNPLICDTYEPGSTFKLITLSAALEERKSNLSETFYCSGGYRIGRERLKCWSYRNPHGSESLKQAVGNSCNPVFIQLGKRLGINTFYNYLDLFGITDKTGVDYPGEAQAIIKSKKNLGPVDFATISYGQGIAVTPIQLLSAVSAIGNEGMMVKPRFVSALKDNDGNTVKKYRTQAVRQVVSRETAKEVKQAMKYVVEEKGGTAAKVKGYTIGGKTGTADNESKKGSTAYYASFVGLAPIDDPKIAILVIVDNPKGKNHGSEVAAPVVKEILESALPYLEIQPSAAKSK